MQTVRDHPRHAVGLEIRFRVLGGEWALGRTQNVSAGGMRVRSADPFPPGEAIEVEIGRDTPSRLAGVVAWAPPKNGAPVEFGVRLLHAGATWYEYCRLLGEVSRAR